MFNDDRAQFILELCTPKEVHVPELLADLALAEALAEDWTEWSAIITAWLLHFGRERIANAVACALRAEESAFLGKRIDDLDVEQFGPGDTCELSLVTQGVAYIWHDIARVDHEYLDRAIKALEITERCSRCARDACRCARIWVALTFEDSLPRALAAMDHAEAFYFADLVVPTETDARTERRHLESLQDGHEAICKEWLRSFGPDFGARCLRQFQERGFALTALPRCSRGQA